MAYQALYRKWRPMKFDDVIGQSHITETVKNEMCSGAVAHAYLFTGTRGTGKTTTAKILSRALNCQSPIDGNPCNECEVCKSIISEVCLDVQEIDAASNTGVDNIRDIISQVQYLPTMGKYKVFIIDEVHMLSKGAFNALLKTLEEPPPHVVFILATTEVQSIPATILSRCQRFDFKNISIEDIVRNIKAILLSEGIESDDDALEYVAYLGDGSMRDSLSILDRCLAFSRDNLSLDKIIDVVGAVDDKILYEFAKDVANNDTTSALERFNGCINDGKNLDNIAKGLLNVFREIIMYKINADNFSASKIKKEYLKECSHLFDVPSLSNYINIISDCIASFKSFASQRVLFECVLVRLTTPQMNSDYDSVLARISALENKIASGAFLSSRNTAENEKNTVENTEKKETAKNRAKESEPVADESDLKISGNNEPKVTGNVSTSEGAVKNVLDKWPEVINYLITTGKLSLYTTLFESKVYEEEGMRVIKVDDESKKHTLTEKTNADVLKDVIVSSTGADVNIKVVCGEMEFENSEDDVFKNLNSLGKDFPGNFNIN